MNKKMLVVKARQIAEQAHAGVTRWGGEPYIVHPERVAKSLERRGHNATIQAVGWLHDVIEDTDWTLDALTKEVGGNVSQYVDIVTHKDGESYSEYIERIGNDFIATLVKLTDLDDNLRDLTGKKNKQRRDKYELAKLYLKNAQGIA